MSLTETLTQTPSQTIGPFFAPALGWHDGNLVVPVAYPNAFWVRGLVLDGAGDPIPDALVETWQAGLNEAGFGRSATDGGGGFAIHTVKPPAVADAAGAAQAPHLDVSVFARGLLKRAVTRIYFVDEPDNDTDPLLARLDLERRATLMAERAVDGYRFDIRLQGERETVFLEL